MEPKTRISFGSWTALASTVAAGVAVAGGFGAGPNLVPAVEGASLRSTAQAAGKMVFFGGNGRVQDFDIYVGTAEGGDLVDLSNNDVWDSGPVFSPNGRQIAFHSDRHGDRDDPPSERNFEVYVMNVDGTDVRRLTNRPGWDGSPSWSPDGRKIAWGTCRVEEGGKCDVAVMNADGSGVTLLTDSDDHFDNSPRWSPNGRQILFTSDRERDQSLPPIERGSDLYVMDSNGSDLRRLTDTGLNAAGRWSPNGRRIVFNRMNDAWIMNADGSGQSKLRYGTSPIWSPNGREIAYGGRDGPSIMDAEGTNLRRLELDFSGGTISVSDWSHP